MIFIFKEQHYTLFYFTNEVHYFQGIIVFASVMATLGLQILLESVREIISKVFGSCIIWFGLLYDLKD